MASNRLKGRVAKLEGARGRTLEQQIGDALGKDWERALADVPEDELASMAEGGEPGPHFRKLVANLRRHPRAKELTALASEAREALIRFGKVGDMADGTLFTVLAFGEAPPQWRC